MSKIFESQMYVTKVSSSSEHFHAPPPQLLILLGGLCRIAFTSESVSLFDFLTEKFSHAHYCIAFTPRAQLLITFIYFRALPS